MNVCAAVVCRREDGEVMRAWYTDRQLDKYYTDWIPISKGLAEDAPVFVSLTQSYRILTQLSDGVS